VLHFNLLPARHSTGKITGNDVNAHFIFIKLQRHIVETTTNVHRTWRARETLAVIHVTASNAERMRSVG
jgi:hypothetical protein